LREIDRRDVARLKMPYRGWKFALQRGNRRVTVGASKARGRQTKMIL